MVAAAKQGRLNGELGAQTARVWAEQLLGGNGLRPHELDDEHPALSWARSGLMALTGQREGEPRMCPVPLTACADGALAALASLAPEGAFAGLRGSQLLAERAAVTGHSRNGATSPGGSCRLLDAADGRIALNLAREDDWALLPAWLEHDSATSWEAVAPIVRWKPATMLVERGREMGLAVAVDEMPRTILSFPRRRESNSRKLDARRSLPPSASVGGGHEKKRPLVIDLSSLWAGPLCGHLLQRCGAEVVKIESLARPDGARQGPAAFFDLLNAGKASVALDFASAQARAQLRELIEAADIVIEASRPRALRQLGIDVQQLVRANPRLTWISITGHGRHPPGENWIAYGDDAGVAAGLSTVMCESTGESLIVGDAIGDPLTGLHAALAAWAGYRGGGCGLVSLTLAGVVGDCIAFDVPAEGWRARARAWTDLLAREGVEPARPRLRASAGLARPLGGDTGILEKITGGEP